MDEVVDECSVCRERFCVHVLWSGVELEPDLRVFRHTDQIEEAAGDPISSRHEKSHVGQLSKLLGAPKLSDDGDCVLYCRIAALVVSHHYSRLGRRSRHDFPAYFDRVCQWFLNEDRLAVGDQLLQNHSMPAEVLRSYDGIQLLVAHHLCGVRIYPLDPVLLGNPLSSVLSQLCNSHYIAHVTEGHIVAQMGTLPHAACADEADPWSVHACTNLSPMLVSLCTWYAHLGANGIDAIAVDMYNIAHERVCCSAD